MNLIVVTDQNWGIGKNGDLLASLPLDMEFFKKKTMEKVIFMGRKTLESFPESKPLPKRCNIVLTRNKDYQIDGGSIVHSKEEALVELSKYHSEDIYIIGGAQIYQEFLEDCENAYVTHVDYEFEADTFFPNLDKNKEWVLESESEPMKDGKYTLSFRTYRKLKGED